MAHTNRHFRYFWCCLSKTSILYTEMVMADEIVRHADNPHELDRLLGCDHEIESPLVLQLGGNDPNTLRHAVRIARSRGYNHFNLNCGCPSNTVASENVMGASLMLDPELTAACCYAMHQELSDSPDHIHSDYASTTDDTTTTTTTAVFPSSSSSRTGSSSSSSSSSSSFPNHHHHQLPGLSVKCRIGVNDKDSYEDLRSFVSTVSRVGRVRRFQIHARKAVLGLNTKDNRLVPPLNYEYVYRLVTDFPSLQFELNGGVESVTCMNKHRMASPNLAGVMVGRACVNHPYSFVGVDATSEDVPVCTSGQSDDISDKFSKHENTFPGNYGNNNMDSSVLNADDVIVKCPSRGEILEKYTLYCESLASATATQRRPVPVSVLLAPVYNLLAGEQGCDKFRRRLKKLSVRCADAASVVRAAATEIPPSALWEGRGLFVPVDRLAVHEKMPRVTAPLHSRIV